MLITNCDFFCVCHQKHEDTELQDLKSLPAPKPASVPDEMSAETFGDVVMLLDFVHSYKFLLVPDKKFNITSGMEKYFYCDL